MVKSVECLLGIVIKDSPTCGGPLLVVMDKDSCGSPQVSDRLNFFHISALDRLELDRNGNQGSKLAALRFPSEGRIRCKITLDPPQPARPPTAGSGLKEELLKFPALLVEFEPSLIDSEFFLAAFDPTADRDHGPQQDQGEETKQSVDDCRNHRMSFK